MRFKTVSSVLEYASWLIKKYTELQQPQENNIYRIVAIKNISPDQYKLVIQIVGKSTIIECTPQEIVLNDRVLNGFSQNDVRTITYFACERVKQPEYKIATQEFSDQSNKILFKLKKCHTNETIFKTANQISLDKNLIDKLSKEDACSIHYIAGYEQSPYQNAK